jgi:hypothetical protein
LSAELLLYIALDAVAVKNRKWEGVQLYSVVFYIGEVLMGRGRR